MWWRACVLEALHAFILGPLASAGRAESRKLQETIAALLAPTLDIISSTPPLQVNIHCYCGMQLLHRSLSAVHAVDCCFFCLGSVNFQPLYPSKRDLVFLHA
jgi:hypothetical protein